MNISLIESLGITSEEIEDLARPLIAAGHDFTYFDTKTTDVSELIDRSRDADILMIANNPLPAEVIEQSSALKMIAVAFTGIDHVALDACRKHGIMVCNCAGYSNISVAELTIGLTLDVLRKISSGNSSIRNGGTSDGLMGSEIAGKTVGIVGVGNIGLQAAKLFRAFGARVLGYARHKRSEAEAAGVEYRPLEDLLESSDIVSLHLPLNDSTRKSFGKAQLALMKPGSVLINCARGAIVDNEALAEALDSGHLSGAGIDVFDMEPPLDPGYCLLKAKGAILTPHIAFLTHEAMQRRARIEFDNVSAYLCGEPQNVCEL